MEDRRVSLNNYTRDGFVAADMSPL